MDSDKVKECRNAFGRTFYRIAYRKELDIVEAVWEGFATRRDLEQALAMGLGFLEQTRCAYRLNDNTACSGPWADSVPWLEEVWLPRAHRAGVRYLAHVAGPDSFGEEAGKALFMGKIGSTIEVGLFTSTELASQWLRAKQEAALLT